MDPENTSVATTDWVTTSSPPDATIWIKDIGLYVHFCAIAVIIPVGLVCNALSVGVFVAAAKFRRTSTGQLLIALSTVDWLVLIGDSLRWLTKVDNREVSITGLTFYDTSDFACKFVNIWRYSTKLLSAWLTVFITLERLLAVAMPLKVGRLSTPFRVRCIVVVMAVICVVLSLFPLWTLNVATYKDVLYCQYVEERADQYDVWLLVVRRVGTLILPTVLLVICSSLIIYFLARAYHARPQSTHGGCHAVTHVQRTSTAKDSSKSTQRQLTIMLVTVCVAAVCLQLPYMTLYLINDRRYSWWPDGKGSVRFAWIYAAKEIAEAISIANYAVNFFLFCVSGSAFRRHVRIILLRICNAPRTSILDASMRTSCTSTSRYSTSPDIRLKVRQQKVDADDDDVVVRLAD